MGCPMFRRFCETWEKLNACPYLEFLMRHYQSPLYRPLNSGVLMMVLWRQYVTAGQSNLMAADVAAVDARIRSNRSGGRQLVESLMLTLFKESGVFIYGHCCQPHLAHPLAEPR